MTKSIFANEINPGAKNIYCCDTCRRHIVTQDLHKGTTPFIISCQVTPRCRGKMYSSLYRVFDPENRLAPTHEWYKPSVLEVIPPQLVEHVSKGGLLMRPVGCGGYAPTERLVRHKKRGTIYRVLGEGKMQAERWYDPAPSVNDYESGPHPVDNQPVVVYEADDGTVWVRPKSEFEDGRFEDV